MKYFMLLESDVSLKTRVLQSTSPETETSLSSVPQTLAFGSIGILEMNFVASGSIPTWLRSSTMQT